MPLVRIVPTNSEIEARLFQHISALRAFLKAAIIEVSGFPENDVIIHLERCPFLDADPCAAQIEMALDTLPHEELESKADGLIDLVAGVMISLGYADVEIWLRFLAGPWCKVVDGEIIERVGHTRKKEQSVSPRVIVQVPQRILAAMGDYAGAELDTFTLHCVGVIGWILGNKEKVESVCIPHISGHPDAIYIDVNLSSSPEVPLVDVLSVMGNILISRQNRRAEPLRNQPVRVRVLDFSTGAAVHGFFSTV